jgi:hypothetical protein
MQLEIEDIDILAALPNLAILDISMYYETWFTQTSQNVLDAIGARLPKIGLVEHKIS